MNNMLRVACWNIKGYDINTILEFVDSYEILGLVQIWTKTDSPINLPCFQCVHLT